MAAKAIVFAPVCQLRELRAAHRWGRRSGSTSRCCQLYLGSRLEDPELLSWRQRRVQRDHYHGAAAVGQVLCDVTARPRQSLDLLLARHEDQDVMGLWGLLDKNNNKNPKTTRASRAIISAQEHCEMQGTVSFRAKKKNRGWQNTFGIKCF